MECHDVRSLLTFAQRGCENLDATEREALQLHLDKCPDCGCLAQAERKLDAVLGKAMRDVAVPAGLKQGVMKRLAAQQHRPTSWKWSGVAAAAAAAMLLAIGGAVWYATALPAVTVADVDEVARRDGRVAEIRNEADSAAEVEKHFEAQGLKVRAPRDFDYRYLERVEIVEFKHRRVAKLTFRNEHARAEVIILPHQQFRTEALENANHISYLIRRDDDFTYLIFHSGGVEPLRVQRV